MPAASRHRRVVAVLAVALLGVLAAGVAVAAAGVDHGPPAGFVVMKNGQLSLDGKPWRFTGVNEYQAATNYSQNSGCGPQDLDPNKLFSRLAPGSAVRLWAYQAFAVDPRRQVFDWRALDKVVADADAAGVKLIMTLSDQSGRCDDGHWHDSAWYQGGYTKIYDDNKAHSSLVSWDAWLRLVVARYANSPAIAYWEPVNEPEPSNCAPGLISSQCYGATTCPANAASILSSFMSYAASEIHTIDRWHPVGEGTLGGDQCGSGGGNDWTDWLTVSRTPGVDVLTVHDYSEQLQSDGVRLRIREATQLGKPLVLEEIGDSAESDGSAGCNGLTGRAAHVEDQIKADFASASVEGFLLWQWLDGRPAGCSVAVAPGDPVLQTLRAPIPAAGSAIRR